MDDTKLYRVTRERIHVATDRHLGPVEVGQLVELTPYPEAPWLWMVENGDLGEIFMATNTEL